MNMNDIRLGRLWFVLVVFAAGMWLLPTGFAYGQATAEDAAAVEITAVEEEPPAEDAAVEDASVEDSGSEDEAAEASGEQAGTQQPDQPDAESADQPLGEAPAAEPVAEAVAEETTSATPGLGPLEMGLIVLALFILPMLIGNYLAKRLKMPDYGWKMSLMFGSLAAALVIITFGQFKFGPDLAGGITLIYELAETAPVADGDGAAAREHNINMDDMIAILKRRIDPTGTREVTVREYGPAIEIIIPETGPDALEFVKRRITEMGQLEFRITADPTQPEERPIIEEALLLPPSQKDVKLGDKKVAEWVAYAEEEFGPPGQENDHIVKRGGGGETPEALVLMDPMDVTGEYLTSAAKGVSDRGGPAVNFSFDSQGARRFKQLTSENRPNPATGAVRYLGIILDKRLISAPSIRETISNHGQISGATMGVEEVEHIVSILEEGRLPLELNKEPISEETISPTLGAVTVQKGKYAIIVSLVVVLLFMLFYYRFAGAVSCFALAANLLLVLSVMVLIEAAFTLPGLAGLVLTIGMSVDANVLIFERIREELAHGAALRMAIRNGFGRATTTIIDANVTTLISGVALYVIGTDQIKGFAVTLILGILMSMYTAIFCSRIFFDVAERRGWVKGLNMSRLIGETHFNFLRATIPSVTCSIVLIVIGLTAVANRGSSLFDIDFTGGSSVTFVLGEDHQVPIGQIRSALLETELSDRNLFVVQLGKAQDRYSVNTSEQSVEKVKDVLNRTFSGELLTYSLDVSDVKPFYEGNFEGSEAQLLVNAGPDYADDDGASHDALLDLIQGTLQETGHAGTLPTLTNPAYKPGSAARYKQWTVRMGNVDESTAQDVLQRLKQKMDSTPMFPLANKIGGRVSSNMQVQAAYAIAVSLLGIIGYLWIRFQKVSFGLAAATAMVHDVLVAIGAIAISAHIVRYVPALATALQLDSFQINLTIVAAILTIMGYSLNDTIVTFDRVREVRGKSPNITAAMINTSVNQTLGRTLLTSFTTLIVVLILYLFGGDGVHAFAFSVVVGVVVGTYSSIYIASPVLLWLNGQSIKEAQDTTEPRQVLEHARQST